MHGLVPANLTISADGVCIHEGQEGGEGAMGAAVVASVAPIHWKSVILKILQSSHNLHFDMLYDKLIHVYLI